MDRKLLKHQSSGNCLSTWKIKLEKLMVESSPEDTEVIVCLEEARKDFMEKAGLPDLGVAK